MVSATPTARDLIHVGTSFWHSDQRHVGRSWAFGRGDPIDSASMSFTKSAIMWVTRLGLVLKRCRILSGIEVQDGIDEFSLPCHTSCPALKPFFNAGTPGRRDKTYGIFRDFPATRRLSINSRKR